MPPLEALQRPQQQSLGFGPVEHFDTIHGRHNGYVAVCHREAGGKFNQAMHEHHNARASLPGLAEYDDIDVFMSQNGFYRFPKVTRQVHHVQTLTSCWADLDFYNVAELRDLDIEDVAERVLDAHPWLPEPTLVIASGRGGYLCWAFDQRVHARQKKAGGETTDKQLVKWDFAMEALTTLLRPFGADVNATDAARVLRVTGSTNTRNGERVILARVVGRPVNFGKFTDLVLDNTTHLHRRPRVVAFPEVEAKAKPGKALVKAPRPFNAAAANLHYGKLEDYRTLAGLRGERFTDYRKRMSYWVACSLSWVCANRDQAVREMEGFIAEYFDEPHRYKARAVDNILGLMDSTHGKIWNGKAFADPRHRAHSATIIADLDITELEQQHFRQILGKAEKGRRKGIKAEKDRIRKLERRRQTGMVAQAEYTRRVATDAAQRRSEALRLRGMGQSVREIAAALRVSERAVWGYLK